MEAANELASFKGYVQNNQIDAATASLTKLKIAMTRFDSLSTMSSNSPNAAQEKQIACETLEHAVLLSVQKQDKDGFQRHISQLKAFYTEGSCVSGDSRSMVIGLNLMFLLVENRLAEFHSELELLEDSERQIEAIAYPIRLEQFLMVGAFNQILAAKSAMPSPSFSFFMGSIVETVRYSIAECAEVAYGSLSLDSAQQLLMLDSRSDLMAFIETARPNWVVENDLISFQPEGGSKSSDIPSMRLIAESLNYATELERIV
jgi:26S proteasome regulatory subunit N12